MRDWLTARHIALVRCNVTSNYDTAKEMYAIGIFAAPLLIVGDAKVLGFRPGKPAAVLSGSCPCLPR